MAESIAFSDWLAEGYPLLWVAGLLLPLALVLYLLCAPKRLDAAARHKKTDDHTPADKVEEKSHDDEKRSHDLKEPVCTHVSEATKIDTKTEDHIEALELSEREAPKEETVHTSENGVSSGTLEPEPTHDLDSESHDQDEANSIESPDASVNTESHDQSHDNEEPPKTNAKAVPSEDKVEEVLQNGTHLENGLDVANGDLSDPSEEAGQRWSFPPVLEQFDLMDTETDPAELEDIFTDERLREIYLDVTPDGPGLGISIVGGQGSPSGDLPIIIKRVLPGSLAEQDGRLKTGDEMVAVNEKLLVGVGKDIAIDALSNLDGSVRLLVLQDE